MKRITLNIDLEDNEAFEKEVEDIIRSEVRKIVRQQQNELIKQESDKEFKRLIEADMYGYRDKLKNIADGIIYQRVKNSLDTLDIEKMVDKAVDRKIEWHSGSVDDKCKAVIERTISENVQKKIKSLLD